MDNPRYTGYAFFGRWTRHEALLDPDDVAAGHVIRFRRSAPDRIIRSRQPAHPVITPVEDFTRAQLLRRSKAAGGLRTARKSERSERPTTRLYLFRGRLRCSLCERKMEASPRAHAMYYRCQTRTMVPGAAALAAHPVAVYLREDQLREEVNAWLGGLFAPENIDATVAALLESQAEPTRPAARRETLKKRLTDAEARLRKFQDAIAAGVDPAAVVDAINEAQAERATAKAELGNAPVERQLPDGDIYARIDSLGDVGAALNKGKPEKLTNLYKALDLQVRYIQPEHVAEISLRLLSTDDARVNSARVRGGTPVHRRGIAPEYGAQSHV